MKTLLQDVAFAFRSFSRKPSFVIIAVLTLALGIGASTTIFSVVDAVILGSLPYRDASRLVQVKTHFPDFEADLVSPLDFFDWRDQNDVLEFLVASRGSTPALLGGGEPQRVMAFAVSWEFFSALGVNPQTGRPFRPEEDQPGVSRTAVLSNRFWQSKWGGASPIGDTVNLDGQPYEVIGVMPASFHPPEALGQQAADLWIPLAFANTNLNSRTRFSLKVIGKLKEGVTLEQGNDRFSALTKAMAEKAERDYRAGLVSLHEQTVGDTSNRLAILLGAVGLLLMITWVNVAHLLLARGTAREQELAMRSALGAGQTRLIRQLLTESVTLALLGGGLGIALAFGGVAAFAAVDPGDIPRVAEVAVDLRVLGFALLLSVFTGILFGLAPAYRLARSDVNAALKEGTGRASSGRRRSRLRGLLVVAETALALILLIGAGLLANSFVRLLSVNPGFDPEQVLRLKFFLPSNYDTDEKTAAFARRLVDQIQSIPGIQSAAIGTSLPLDQMDAFLDVFVEGREGQPEDSEGFHQISAGYFKTLGIEFVEGRDFREQDKAGSQLVAIVNKAFARKYWPGQSALERRLKIDNPWVSVVGVVEDARYQSLEKEPVPELYVLFDQMPGRYLEVIARSGADFQATAPAMRRAVWDIDPNLPIERFDSLTDVVSLSVRNNRFYTLLLSAFASVALLLAAVGIYGTISYAAEQRTQEMGVRMAFGARVSDVLRIVVGKGMALSVIGIALGLVGAWALMRVLSSWLYGITASDPVTYAVVSVLLALVSLLACYLPARRATRFDPMTILRAE